MSGWFWSVAAGAAGLALGFVAATVLTRRRSARQLVRVRAAERRARAAERLAEIGSMTGGLAHEIKNPLSTIGLNAQLLSEGIAELDAEPEAKSRLTRRIDALGREAERLRGILTDFLDYAGEKHLSPATTDLNLLVDELADFFHPQAERAHVRLRTTLSPEPARAEVDAGLVKQAILNLLLNAVQAFPDDDSGPRELMLRVDQGEDDGEPVARIRVADTGPGIDREALARIFSPYFTTKAGGTGLGLPTARRIIEQHGARIDVHSEPGRGTEFVLTFPALPGDSAGQHGGDRRRGA
jgi:signal transduction histidine kinase